MSQNDPICVSIDEDLYWGYTPLEIIRQMKLEDWARPQDLLEFKQNCARRAKVLGCEFEYYDATSFLMGLEKVGLIKIVTFSQKVAKYLDKEKPLN